MTPGDPPIYPGCPNCRPTFGPPLPPWREILSALERIVSALELSVPGIKPEYRDLAALWEIVNGDCTCTPEQESGDAWPMCPACEAGRDLNDACEMIRSAVRKWGKQQCQKT